MNTFWSRCEGLILTDVHLSEDIVIESKEKNIFLIQCLMSCIRKKESPIFNGKYLNIKSIKFIG